MPTVLKQAVAMLRGLLVTGRYALRPPVTTQYPDEKTRVEPRFKGRHWLTLYADGLERCVGCEVCVHIPQKKTNPYELTVCPWNAIEMVPTELAAQTVAQIGGPPEYIVANWDRLVGTAQHLAELKAAG